MSEPTTAPMSETLAALRERVSRLPTHTRRNGWATPRLWVDRRDVLRLIDDALAATLTPPEIDAERLSRWAEWIVSDNHGPDWACAECRPKSDMLVSGFRCVPHDAAAYRDAP